MRLIDANALMAEMHNIILEDGDDRKTFYEVIERQPTVNQIKWIPVSDGLPLSGEEVNVSVCDETGDTRYNYTSHGWLTTDKEYWIVDNEINNYVVAWMPLPKPYKGEKYE